MFSTPIGAVLFKIAIANISRPNNSLQEKSIQTELREFIDGKQNGLWRLFEDGILLFEGQNSN